MEENAESKELQIRKLEATVKSLSEELIKVCEASCSLSVHWHILTPGPHSYFSHLITVPVSV